MPTFGHPGNFGTPDPAFQQPVPAFGRDGRNGVTVNSAPPKPFGAPVTQEEAPVYAPPAPTYYTSTYTQPVEMTAPQEAPHMFTEEDYDRLDQARHNANTSWGEIPSKMAKMLGSGVLASILVGGLCLFHGGFMKLQQPVAYTALGLAGVLSAFFVMQFVGVAHNYLTYRKNTREAQNLELKRDLPSGMVPASVAAQHLNTMVAAQANMQQQLLTSASYIPRKKANWFARTAVLGFLGIASYLVWHVVPFLQAVSQLKK